MAKTQNKPRTYRVENGSVQDTMEVIALLDPSAVVRRNGNRLEVTSRLENRMLNAIMQNSEKYLAGAVYPTEKHDFERMNCDGKEVLGY